MLRLYAVQYKPQDGPHSSFLIQAEHNEAAREQVLQYLHDIDMDAVTKQELTAVDLGFIEDLTVLGTELNDRIDVDSKRLFVELDY